jgi:pyruvate dehydrogenase E2 component (dihydrolipoamide acetyltransferase)
VVAVGTIVAVIAEPGEQPDRIEGIRIREISEGPAPTGTRPATPQPEAPSEKIFLPASPAARRLAKELDVDLARVRGSGPEGRITEADVQRFRDEGPPAPKITPLAEEIARQAGLDLSAIQGTGEDGKITKEDVQRVLAARKPALEAIPVVRSIPFAGMRRSIAQNMHASLHNTAQLTAFVEVDVSEMVRFRNMVRDALRSDESAKVSYNDILILAVSRALKRHPVMNSTLVGEEILLHAAVNIGIAVALAEGLIVPVLRNADRMGLLEIARGSRELVRKAREGTLSVDEVTGGTFTITNMSMFQIDGVTPILRPPETGILGVGRIKEKPAVFNGQIAIRSMMFLSLTFDHQVVDGAPANQFLGTVAAYLENPYLIMS